MTDEKIIARNAHSNPLYDIGNLNPLHSEHPISST